MAPVTEERRRFPRHASTARCEVQLIRPQGRLDVEHLNFSDQGVCLRVREALEVRALVQLHFTPEAVPAERSGKTLECAGRVAWVVQRLDLRASSPFLFDVGIELIDPPQTLRDFLPSSDTGPSSLKPQVAHPSSMKAFAPWEWRARHYVPNLHRIARPSLPWHLVVLVDDMPCFSGRFPSERAALAAWEKFKREQGRRG